MHLRISTLWIDDDGMLQVELSASSRGNACELDFYAYPEQLTEFGEALSAFSGAAGQSAVFEIGSPKERSYCWIRVEAYPIDGVGHSALEICARKNGARHVSMSSMFSAELEVASINELGLAVKRFGSGEASEVDFSRTEH